MHRTTVPSIAVVDPDPTNCHLLREVCHAGGWFAAGCAHDVAEGMALLARTRPDCLILDYKFSGSATGLDLLARAKPLLPNLFSVMLTGWDINDVAAHVTTHQPDRILRKPVPPHALITLLESVYGEAEGARIRVG